jgi:hypothetical protein
MLAVVWVECGIRGAQEKCLLLRVKSSRREAAGGLCLSREAASTSCTASVVQSSFNSFESSKERRKEKDGAEERQDSRPRTRGGF